MAIPLLAKYGKYIYKEKILENWAISENFIKRCMSE
jgi:hypothetical protein